MKHHIVCLILCIALTLGIFTSCADKSELDVKTEDYATAADASGSLTNVLNDGAFAEEAEEVAKGDDDADFGSPEVYVEGTAAGESEGDTNSSSDLSIQINAGTLTAGEWKDNDHYDFWCSLFEREEWKSLANKWKLIPDMRFSVTLINGQNAAKNVRVEMYAGEHLLASAVSDSYGKAYLNPHLLSWHDESSSTDLVAADTLTVYFDGDAHDYPITADDLAAGGMSVTDAVGKKASALDLMFVTDTTGSMGDELEYLKKELGNVISTVSEENESLEIALSLNFYRDTGDEYVVKSAPFDTDIEACLKKLDVEFSEGGGDYPEAVHLALDDAINAHEWRDDSIKLLFLVLDAPPHAEDEEVIEKMRTLIANAATKGIRIIPVASSGVDTETEFLLRSAAVVSGGTYTFLTDHSGVGEAHLEPTIGDYNVKKLNELLIKIISEYCK